MAAGGFLGHSARATISLRHVMAKSISLAKQLTVQGSYAAARVAGGLADGGARRNPRGRARICAISAQQSANPEHAAQMHCQPAAHRQVMTPSTAFFTLARPWRISRRPKSQPVATSPLPRQDRTKLQLDLLHPRAADRPQRHAGHSCCSAPANSNRLPRPQLWQFSGRPVRRAQAGRCDPARAARRSRHLCRCISQMPPTPGRTRTSRTALLAERVSPTSQHPSPPRRASSSDPQPLLLRRLQIVDGLLQATTVLFRPSIWRLAASSFC